MADKKARDIMSGEPECIGENDTVLDAAKRLAELDVGSMPICGEDDRLKGMLTDRDIVVKVLAKGKDPASVRAGELGAGDGKTVTIGADDSIDEALHTMTEHKVRRPARDRRQAAGRHHQPGRRRHQHRRGEASATSSRRSPQRPRPSCSSTQPACATSRSAG